MSEEKHIGPLKNKRHEAFSQACAVGMSASDAYRATYGTNSKHIDSLSSRLALSVNVRKRIIAIQAQSEHHTHLTIQEKRSIYAREIKDRRNPLGLRLKAMRDDSELGGHIKTAEAGGVHVNVNVAMLTEDRRAELMEKKRQALQRRKERTPIAIPALNGRNGHN